MFAVMAMRLKLESLMNGLGKAARQMQALGMGVERMAARIWLARMPARKEIWVGVGEQSFSVLLTDFYGLS